MRREKERREEKKRGEEKKKRLIRRGEIDDPQPHEDACMMSVCLTL
jgi:hypothetical protein